MLTLGLPTTVGFFASQGFPGWTAYLVVAAEIGGGALMILGVQTRAIALLMLPILIGALKRASAERLRVLVSERRLGISGVPDRRLRRAGFAR